MCVGLLWNDFFFLVYTYVLCIYNFIFIQINPIDISYFVL